MASRKHKPMSVKSVTKNNIIVEIIQNAMNVYSIVIDTQTEKHRHNQVCGESGGPSIGLYAATENKKQKQKQKKKAKTTVQEKQLTTPVTWVFASTDNKKECKQEHNDKRIFIRTTRIVGGGGKSLSLRSWTFVRKDIENENSVAENENSVAENENSVAENENSVAENENSVAENDALLQNYGRNGIGLPTIKKSNQTNQRNRRKQKSNPYTNVLKIKNSFAASIDVGSVESSRDRVSAKVKHKKQNKEMCTGDYGSKQIHDENQRRKRNNKERYLRIDKVQIKASTPKPQTQKKRKLKVSNPESSYKVLCQNLWQRRKTTKMIAAKREEGEIYHEPGEKVPKRRKFLLPGDRGTRGAYQKIKKFERARQNCDKGPFLHKKLSRRSMNELALQRYEGKLKKHEKYINMNFEEAPKHEKNMNMKNKEAPKHEKYMNRKNEEAPKHEKNMNMKNEEAPKHEKNMNMKNKEAPKYEKYMNMKNEEAPKHEKHMNMKNEESPKHEKNMNMKNKEAPKHEKYMNMKNEEAPKHEKNMNMKNEEAPKHERYMNMNNEEAPKPEKNMNMKNKEPPKHEKYMNMNNEEALKHEKNMNMKNKEAPKHEKYMNMKNEEAPSHVICKDPLSSTVLVNSDVTIKLMKGLGLLVDLEPEAIQTEVSFGEVFEDVVLESSNCNDDLDYKHV